MGTREEILALPQSERESYVDELSDMYDGKITI